MSQIAAIAWDIDGTLVDSEPLHHAMLVAVCDACGVDIRDIPEERFIGVHIGDVWTQLAPRIGAAQDRESWIEAIIERYIRERNSLVPVPDALSVMERLQARGIRQVCVSSSGRRIVDANLDAIGAARFMDFTISLDDVVRAKPHPEPYRRAAERLGVEPHRVVAIEDSPTGAASALAAGLRVIAVGEAFARVNGAEAGFAGVGAIYDFLFPDAVPPGNQAEDGRGL